MPEFESGHGAAVLIDGRDESRLSNKINMQDGREILDITCFQMLENAKEYTYGLGSGASGLEGYSNWDVDTTRAQLSTAFGRDVNKKKVLIGPRGLTFGAEANFFESLLADISADLTLAGVPVVQANFSTTKSMIRDGVCLHALNGAASVDGNEHWRLTLAGADEWQYYAFRDVVTQETAQWRISDYASEALFKAGVKSKLEGMAAYAGRTVTVTTITALAGGATRTGVFGLTISGQSNADNMDIISGAVRKLVITNGDTANYTSNGGGAFQLGITEANYQLNQRALVGHYANVVCKGTSTAASYSAGADVLTTAMVAASSGSNGTVGSFTNAVDNNNATQTEIGNNSNAYFDYDLGANPPALYGWTLRGGSVNGVTGTLYGSNNPFPNYPTNTGGTVIGTAVTANANTKQSVNFGTVQTYRYYRIATNASPASPQVSEVEFLAAVLTPGTLSMMSYFPIGATPAATAATGTGAVATQEVAAGSLPLTAYNVTESNGGVTETPIYNVVVASGSDEWIDNGAASVGYGAVSHVASLSIGGSVQVITDHADNLNGAPNLATSAELCAHTHTATGAKFTGDPTVNVKRWTRCRYVLTGAQAVFASALARD